MDWKKTVAQLIYEASWLLIQSHDNRSLWYPVIRGRLDVMQSLIDELRAQSKESQALTDLRHEGRDWATKYEGRDCTKCPYSKDIGTVHRCCEHPDAPEKPPYKRDLHNTMAYYEKRPQDWCPLEKENS